MALASTTTAEPRPPAIAASTGLRGRSGGGGASGAWGAAGSSGSVLRASIRRTSAGTARLGKWTSGSRCLCGAGSSA